MYAPIAWGVFCCLPFFVPHVLLLIFLLGTSTSKYYILIQLYDEENIDYKKYLMIFFWNHNIYLICNLTVQQHRRNPCIFPDSFLC